MRNVYITGDTHGDLYNVIQFCEKNSTTIDDVLIILGDTGFNYYLNYKDERLKHEASKLPITLFCVRGNHEERPENIESYKMKSFADGSVYYETEYPNILFAEDGGMYDFNGKRCLCIGGAYSVDKNYRLMCGWHWFEQEQLSIDEQEVIISEIYELSDRHFNYVFTHTCPYSVRPTHLFLSGIDQSSVDNSMEHFLEDVADHMITFDRWYFGHFHDEWSTGKYQMVFKEIRELGD